MRTISTQQVLWSIARKMGLDPHVNLNENISNALLGYMDERCREIWEAYDWQDLTIYEQRAYADDVVDGKAYNQGDVVFDPSQNLYFQSKYGGAGLPSEFPGLWTNIQLGYTKAPQPLFNTGAPQPTVVPAFVPFVQPGKGVIDTVFDVYGSDPRLTEFPIPATYSVTARGIELRRTHFNTVWVVYRPPYPGVGIEKWDTTMLYNTGDNVYVNGDTWASLTDNNAGNSPSTSSAFWSLFRIPYVLKDYVVTMSYGDALREDGQGDAAQVQYQMAEAKAINQFEKQQTQQGQVSFYGVIQQRRCGAV